MATTRQSSRRNNRPMSRSEAGRLGAEARWGRSYHRSSTSSRRSSRSR